MKKLMLTVVSILALASLTANASLVGEFGILNTEGTNPATGQVWKAGDQYRLIFVSSAVTDATSTDIATYNAFVQGLADAAGLGRANWYAVGSTAVVDARDNTSTNPTTDGKGEPILLMDGVTVIANNYADLWNGINVTDGSDGNWYSIQYDENGETSYPQYGRVYTGSSPNGTASTDQGRVLGGSAEATPRAQTGKSWAGHRFGGNNWMTDWSDPVTDKRPVYGMSETLTVQENYPTVDAGHSWITWSDEPVLLDPVVVNNDTQVPQRNLICVWTAEPTDGVSITEDGTVPDDTTTSQAVVTVTKPADTGDVFIVTLKLSVTLEGVVTIDDTVTIDVYDNSCLAAEAAGIVQAFSPADFNRDCFVDVDDLAALAAAWLDNYSSVDPSGI